MSAPQGVAAIRGLRGEKSVSQKNAALGAEATPPGSVGVFRNHGAFPRLQLSASQEFHSLWRIAEYSDSPHVAPASCRPVRLPPGRRRDEDWLSHHYANVRRPDSLRILRLLFLARLDPDLPGGI